MWNFLYRRGYLITNGSLQNRPEGNLHHWNRYKFSSLSVYTDPDVNYLSYKTGSIEIACIGILLDPVNEWVNTTSILEKGAEALHNSSDLFWDYIDTLGGRFVILLKKEDQHITFQDAVGTRSLFYYNDPSDSDILISSHSELIADLKRLDPDPEAVSFMNDPQFRNNPNRYYPTLATPYRNVFSLTPNTYLNIHTNNVVRFFPRKSWRSEKEHSPVHEVPMLLKNQLKLLNQEYDLAISLTGGLDSRLTLAASREIKDDILYFTSIYSNNHTSSKISTQYAKRLSERFQLNHQTLRYEGHRDSKFHQLFKKNTSQTSTEYRACIAELLYHTYPEGRLHIKSNAVDMSKTHSRRRFAYLPPDSQPVVFSRLHGNYNHVPYVNREMEYFIKTTGLVKKNIYDYDLYDLYTWEHGNGKWQSLCLYEWDTVQDTVIIYSNRSVLKHFIFQSIGEKKRNAMHYRLIKMMWPDLLEIEIEKFGTLPWKPVIRRVKGLGLRLKLLLNRL